MREIYKIYASTFLVGIGMSISVITTLYYLSNGLSQTQIALLSSLFFISFALLEIPTGGIADTFGHKTSVFLGLITYAAGVLLIGLYPSFSVFLIGAVLTGLGFALQSGAYSSLIHDLLTRLGRSEEYTKVQGRTSAYLLIGTLAASPVVSIIFNDYPRLSFILASISLFLAGILIYLVKWEFKGEKPSIRGYFRRIKVGVTLSFTNKRIVALIIIGSILFFTGNLFANNINQPLQISLGIDVAMLGIIAAVFSGFKALTSAFAYRILQKIGVSFSLLLSIIIPAIAFIILSQINTTLGLVFILLLTLGAVYKDQIILTLLQKEVRDEQRSTMISTYSFLIFILVGLTMPLGGFGIDTFGMRNILIISGILTLVFGLIGLAIYKSNNKTF